MNEEIKNRLEMSWHHLLDAIEEIRNIAEDIEETDPKCSGLLDDICDCLQDEANNLYQIL